MAIEDRAAVKESDHTELQHRLNVLKDRVRGVAYRHAAGLYVCGRPGTGKTWTVRAALADTGRHHHYHSGHLTPMGLFDLLAEEPDGLFVLDDVGMIFDQPPALQLLLAALGNSPGATKGRVVTYRRQGREQTVQFAGGIISISNLEFHPTPLLEALKSRVHYLTYDPSEDQLAALMLDIAAKGWPASAPKMSAEECREVADFVIAECQRFGCRLDLRLLLHKAFPDYVQHREGQANTHWTDLVRTTLTEHLRGLVHTPLRGSRREARKSQEHRVLSGILSEFVEPQNRLAAWKQATGKSGRAFYRRLEELGDEPVLAP